MTLRPGLEEGELLLIRTTDQEMPATLQAKVVVLVKADLYIYSILFLLNDQILPHISDMGTTA